MKHYNISPTIDFLRKMTNIHRPGSAPNVFIFSLPRSGSTWLMELIWTQPGFKYCNEPLNLKGSWMCKNTGINGFDELYSDEARGKLVKYFKAISSGKKHFLDPSPFRKNYRPLSSRIVYKVIHGGEKFINDIVDACNGKVIYLLRHPIPVALSRKVLPRMDQLCSDFVLQYFTPEEKEYALKLNREGNDMERRMLAWCLQNKFALLGRRGDWIVISYEQLTVNPGPIIEKLVNDFQLPEPQRIYKQLRIPSAVSVQSENASVELMRTSNIERGGLINRWQNKVTKAEAVNLMQICEKFGLDIYSAHSPMPNDEWLLK